MEYSGKVREAFRAKGHDAWSCNYEPAEDGSPNHIRGDMREQMNTKAWEAFGLHPDCTYLTVAGIHWNNRGRGWEKTNEALANVRELMELAGNRKWYLENPVSIISTNIRKPDQTIQPYEFGEDASKRTCLWLNGLPLLRPTAFVNPRYVCCGVSFGYEYGKRGCTNCCGQNVARPRWANQTDSGQNKLTPSPTRWKERSRTYAGIANAMASQWGAA